MDIKTLFRDTSKISKIVTVIIFLAFEGFPFLVQFKSIIFFHCNVTFWWA